MKTVSLGNKGQMVPAIGQGTMGIGGFFDRDESNDAEFIRLLRLGFDLGMTVIDTAEVYGNGHAEELVGKAITEIRKKTCIVTKFSANHSRAKDVIAAAERSLKRLGTDYIDIYMPHWPNPNVPLDETLEALSCLLRAGKIKWVGLSNFGVEDAARVQSYFCRNELVCLQNEYSLIERTVEQKILPFCINNEITLMSYSPYCQGKLLVRNKRTQPLFEMASDYGVSESQLALAWLLKSDSVIVIPKAAREENLRANATALSLKISQADLNALSIAFTLEVQEIQVNMIDLTDSFDGRKVYKTLTEAIANELDMIPSPKSICEEILASGGQLQKPIKLRRDFNTGRFELLEGRTKYWAWIMAYGTSKPIPAIIE